MLFLEPVGIPTAPRDLSIPGAKIVSVEAEETQSKYRNVQWVQFGEPGVRPFTMSEVSDGIRTVYPTVGLVAGGEIRSVAPIGTVTVGGVTKTVSTVGDAAHEWWFRDEPGAVQLELQPHGHDPGGRRRDYGHVQRQFPRCGLPLERGHA